MDIKKFIINKRAKHLRLAIPLVVGASLSGCMIYPDGRVTSAFDQGAIKAELIKAEKEYGGR